MTNKAPRITEGLLLSPPKTRYSRILSASRGFSLAKLTTSAVFELESEIREMSKETMELTYEV
jgi:hypothetical protein